MRQRGPILRTHLRRSSRTIFHTPALELLFLLTSPFRAPSSVTNAEGHPPFSLYLMPNRVGGISLLSFASGHYVQF